MKTHFLKLSFTLVGIFTFLSSDLYAQCDTWHQNENKEELMSSYVIYRDLMKRAEFEQAFSYWKIVYNNSPAIDGRLSNIYKDGINLYTYQFRNEKELKKKSEIVKAILQLNEEKNKCFPGSNKIILPKEIREFRS